MSPFPFINDCQFRNRWISKKEATDRSLIIDYNRWSAKHNCSLARLIHKLIFDWLTEVILTDGVSPGFGQHPVPYEVGDVGVEQVVVDLGVAHLKRSHNLLQVIYTIGTQVGEERRIPGKKERENKIYMVIFRYEGV